MFFRKLIALTGLFAAAGLLGCAPVKPRPGYSPEGGNKTVEKATQFLEKMGQAAMAQGNYAKAIADFTRAVKINPKDPILWKDLGEAYMAAKFYDDAEKALLKALRLKPDYGDAIYDLGLLYFQKGDYSKAIYWLSRAANLPTYENRYLAYYQLAQVYKKLGDESNYLKNLQTAINLYPRFSAALLEIANYYVSKGAFDKAEPYFVQYLSYYPSDWNVALTYADLLIEHNRFKEARAILKNIVNSSQNPQVVSKAYKLINKLLLKEAQQKINLQNNS